MKNLRARKIAGAVVLLAALASISHNLISLGFPKDIRIIEGKEHQLSLRLPIKYQLHANEEQPLTINGFSLGKNFSIDPKNPLIFQSSKMGTYNFECKWLGFIPVKKVTVHVLPETKVIPGGHSLGVKLRPEGVIVVGFASVIDENGIKQYPSKEAGIEIGDSIYMINHQRINQSEDMSMLLNELKNENITLTLKRNGTSIELAANPVKTRQGHYQLGLWVKDIAAGVGTLSFFDPSSGCYGALGHIISDADTGKAIEVGQGEIIRSKITSIIPGKKNQPGEKRGVFINEERIIGNILENTPLGIFGQILVPVENPKYPLIPIAVASQVHEGNATILTVVEGEVIQEFNIEIQKVLKQNMPGGKGMIIKITDEELILKTGGIVQGMSGSPIIQDGLLAGAVTHVFVNDPTKGYGIFAEWMLDEIKKIYPPENKNKNNIGKTWN